MMDTEQAPLFRNQADLERSILENAGKIRNGLKLGSSMDLSGLIKLAGELEVGLTMRFRSVDSPMDILRQMETLMNTFLKELPSLLKSSHGKCESNHSGRSDPSGVLRERPQRPTVRIAIDDEDWPTLGNPKAIADHLRKMDRPWNLVASVQKLPTIKSKVLHMYLNNVEDHDALLAEAQQPNALQKIFNFKKPGTVQREHYIVLVEGAYLRSTSPQDLRGHFMQWSEDNKINIVDASWRDQTLRVHLDNKDQANKLCDFGWFNHCGGVYRATAWERSFDPFVCYKCSKPDAGHGALQCTNEPRCLFCGKEHNIRNCSRDPKIIRCANCEGRHRADSRKCVFPNTVSMFARLDKRIASGAYWRRQSSHIDAEGFETVPRTYNRHPPGASTQSSKHPRNRGPAQTILKNYFDPLVPDPTSSSPSRRRNRAKRKRTVSPAASSCSPAKQQRVQAPTASPTLGSPNSAPPSPVPELVPVFPSIVGPAISIATAQTTTQTTSPLAPRRSPFDTAEETIGKGIFTSTIVSNPFNVASSSPSMNSLPSSSPGTTASNPSIASPSNSMSDSPSMSTTSVPKLFNFSVQQTPSAANLVPTTTATDGNPLTSKMPVTTNPSSPGRHPAIEPLTESLPNATISVIASMTSPAVLFQQTGLRQRTECPTRRNPPYTGRRSTNHTLPHPNPFLIHTNRSLGGKQRHPTEGYSTSFAQPSPQKRPSELPSEFFTIEGEPSTLIQSPRWAPLSTSPKGVVQAPWPPISQFGTSTNQSAQLGKAPSLGSSLYSPPSASPTPLNQRLTDRVNDGLGFSPLDNALSFDASIGNMGSQDDVVGPSFDRGSLGTNSAEHCTLNDDGGIVSSAAQVHSSSC
jgi:hypothetical protein